MLPRFQYGEKDLVEGNMLDLPQLSCEGGSTLASGHLGLGLVAYNPTQAQPTVSKMPTCLPRLVSGVMEQAIWRVYEESLMCQIWNVFWTETCSSLIGCRLFSLVGLVLLCQGDLIWVDRSQCLVYFLFYILGKFWRFLDYLRLWIIGLMNLEHVAVG